MPNSLVVERSVTFLLVQIKFYCESRDWCILGPYTYIMNHYHYHSIINIFAFSNWKRN